MLLCSASRVKRDSGLVISESFSREIVTFFHYFQVSERAFPSSRASSEVMCGVGGLCWVDDDDDDDDDD